MKFVLSAVRVCVRSIDDGCARCAADERRANHAVGELIPLIGLDDLGEDIDRSLCEQGLSLVDGGQRDLRQGRIDDIVEAEKGNVVRDSDTELVRRLHGAEGSPR